MRRRVGVNLKYPAMPPAAALCPASPLENKHALLYFIWKGGPIELMNKHHATAPSTQTAKEAGKDCNKPQSFFPWLPSVDHTPTLWARWGFPQWGQKLCSLLTISSTTTTTKLLYFSHVSFGWVADPWSVVESSQKKKNPGWRFLEPCELPLLPVVTQALLKWEKERHSKESPQSWWREVKHEGNEREPYGGRRLRCQQGTSTNPLERE